MKNQYFGNKRDSVKIPRLGWIPVDCATSQLRFNKDWPERKVIP